MATGLRPVATVVEAELDAPPADPAVGRRIGLVVAVLDHRHMDVRQGQVIAYSFSSIAISHNCEDWIDGHSCGTSVEPCMKALHSWPVS